MTIETAGQDRLYFQRERELLAAVAEDADQCESLAAAVCGRLVVLDLIDDALAFNGDGYDDGLPNRFRGQPTAWLQQRLGEAAAELAGAAQQLQSYARQLEHSAQLTPRSGKQTRIARGYSALAVEASRVVESYGPCRDAVLPNWPLINRIHDGVRRLEALDAAELREELAQDLRNHAQRLADLRAAGLGDAADAMAADSVLRRAQGTMRKFVNGVPA